MSVPTLPDALEVLEVALAEWLPKELDRLRDGGDWASAARLLAALRTTRGPHGPLGLAEMDVETLLVELLPGKVTVVPGLGSVEVKGGKDRKAYDHAALASLVAARAADSCYWDRDSGEAYPPAVTAQKVVDQLLACAGVAYWKVGGLATLGIDVDDHCDVTPGRRSVVIREVGP